MSRRSAAQPRTRKGKGAMPDKHWLRVVFDRIDTDRSGTIDSAELQACLSNGSWERPFNKHTCRIMIGLFDRSGNGTLEFDEFCDLWTYVQRWTDIFNYFDEDGSGDIDKKELRKCLEHFGYRLTPQWYNFAVRKFSPSQPTSILFDDFIRLCIYLQALTSAFRALDTDRDGVITVQYEDFLVMVLRQAVLVGIW